jgi:alpha,alpha-trehalase
VAAADPTPLPDLFALGLKAVLLDLDGVVTRTASVHARAWQRLFDEFLASHAGGGGFEPFTTEDYVAHVDGKPRAQGVRAFLRARGIDLPAGEASDPATAATVAGLTKRKNGLFLDVLAAEGIEVFASSVALIRALQAAGIACACVSASKNCRVVLERTGLTGAFAAIVDGNDVERLHLAGKPAPDAFLYAARLLGVTPAEAAVVEDATVGVQAGQAGGFALVIGVDRGAVAARLLAAGADLVVDDLGVFALPAFLPLA